MKSTKKNEIIKLLEKKALSYIYKYVYRLPSATNEVSAFWFSFFFCSKNKSVTTFRNNKQKFNQK